MLRAVVPARVHSVRVFAADHDKEGAVVIEHGQPDWRWLTSAYPP